jgi:hypothetical protein
MASLFCLFVATAAMHERCTVTRITQKATLDKETLSMVVEVPGISWHDQFSEKTYLKNPDVVVIVSPLKRLSCSKVSTVAMPLLCRAR